jgi:hypothetical protein
MIVTTSKVNSLCTSSEIALVKASRPPELNQLKHSELKRLALRARKLVDKAHDQGRSQARAKSRQMGSGSTAARTLLKTRVLSDALKSFEAWLARLDAPAAPAAAGPRPKTKKIRNAAHRATRAKIRKSLAGHKASR